MAEYTEVYSAKLNFELSNFADAKSLLRTITTPLKDVTTQAGAAANAINRLDSSLKKVSESSARLSTIKIGWEFKDSTSVNLKKIRDQVRSRPIELSVTVDDQAITKFRQQIAGIGADFGRGGGMAMSKRQQEQFTGIFDVMFRDLQTDKDKLLQALDDIAGTFGVTTEKIVANLRRTNVTAAREWLEFARVGTQEAEKLYDDLVGHSIIPDMVAKIKSSLGGLRGASKSGVDDLSNSFDRVRETGAHASTDLSTRLRGLQLAFSGTGNKAQGLREALFGIGATNNIVARALEKITGDTTELGRAQNALQRGIVDITNVTEGSSRAMVGQLNILKQVHREEGGRAQDLNQVQLQMQRVNRAINTMNATAKKGGDVTESMTRVANEVRGLEKEYKLLIEQGVIKAGTESDRMFKAMIEDARSMQAQVQAAGARYQGLRRNVQQVKDEQKAATKATAEAGKEQRGVSIELDKSEGSAKKFTSQLKLAEKAATGIKLAIAGLFLGGGIGLGLGAITGAIGDIKDFGKEVAAQSTIVAARLGETGEVAKTVGNIVKNVWRDNFGGSVEEVGQVVTELATQMRRFGDVTDQELTAAAENVYRITDAYKELDFKETIDAQRTLVDNFGITWEQASDLIVTGMQRGLNTSGDFLDSIREYSNQFANAGATASEMFNIMDSGLSGGQLGTDKAADAFKEFQVRILDGSVATNTALKQIGINTKDFTGQLSRGEITIAQAFDTVINRLRTVDNQAVLMQAGVGLLGTMFEDIGVKSALSLSTTGVSMNEMAGKTNALNYQYQTMGAVVQGVWRSISTSMAPVGTAMLDLANRTIPYINAALASIQPIIQTISDLVSGNWQSAWINLQTFAVSALENIVMGLEWLAGAGFDWGFSFIEQVAIGIINAVNSVLVNAVNQVGNLIASFLMPGSPPEQGPLSTIDQWGEGLMDTFSSSMGEINPLESLDEQVEAARKNVLLLRQQVKDADRLGGASPEMKRKLALAEEELATLIQKKNATNDATTAQKQFNKASGGKSGGLGGASKLNVEETAKEIYDKQVAILKEKFRAGLIDQEEYLKNLLKLEEDYADKSLKDGVGFAIDESAKRIQSLKSQLAAIADSKGKDDKPLAISYGADIVTGPGGSNFGDIISTSLEDAATKGAKSFTDGLTSSLKTRMSEATSKIGSSIKEAVSGAFGQVRSWVTGLPPEKVFPLTVVAGIFASPLVYGILDSYKLILPALSNLSGLLGGFGGILKTVLGLTLKWSVAGLVIFGIFQNWDEIVQDVTIIVAFLSATFAELGSNVVGFINRLRSSGDLDKIVGNLTSGLSLLGLAVTQVFGLLKKVFKAILFGVVIGGIGAAVTAINAFIETFGGVGTLAEHVGGSLVEISDAFRSMSSALFYSTDALFRGDFATAWRYIVSIPGRITEAFSGGATASLFKKLGDTLAAMLPPQFLSAFQEVLGYFDGFMEKGRLGGEVALLLNEAFSTITTIIQENADVWPILGGVIAAVAGIIGDTLLSVLQVLPDILPFIEQALSGVVRFVRGIVEGIRGLFYIFRGIWSLIKGDTDAAKLYFAQAGQAIIGGLITMAQGLGMTLSAVFGGIITAVVSFVGNFLNNITTFTGYLDGWGEAVLGFKDWVVQIFTDLYNILVGQSIIPDMIMAIWDWFERLPTQVISFVLDTVSGIIDTFSGVDWGDLGYNVIRGIIKGLQDNKNLVINWIKGLANDIIGSVKDVLGIQSPSLEFRNIGINIIQGLNIGLSAIKPDVASVIGEVQEDIEQNIKDKYGVGKDVAEAMGERIKKFGKEISALYEAGNLTGETAIQFVKDTGDIHQGKIDERKLANYIAKQYQTVRVQQEAAFRDVIRGDLANLEEFNQTRTSIISQFQKNFNEIEVSAGRTFRAVQRALGQNISLDELTGMYNQMQRGVSYGEGINNAISLAVTEQMKLNDAMEEQRRIEAESLKIAEQQRKLDFLKQQLSVVQQIEDYGLNGAELLEGLKLGINASTADVVEAMTRVTDAVLTQMTSALEIASPSKVFERFGGNITAGLKIGLLKGVGSVRDATATIARSIPIGMAGIMGAASQIGNTYSRETNVNIQANYAQYQSPATVGDDVMLGLALAG